MALIIVVFEYVCLIRGRTEDGGLVGFGWFILVVKDDMSRTFPNTEHGHEDINSFVCLKDANELWKDALSEIGTKSC